MSILDFAVVAIIGALMVGFVYAEGGSEPYGGGTYKINEGGSVKLIESVNQGLSKEPCHGHENCFKITANDTLPIAVNEKNYGYGAGKKEASDKIDPFVNRVAYYAYCENNRYGLYCWAWSNVMVQDAKQHTIIVLGGQDKFKGSGELIKAAT